MDHTSIDSLNFALTAPSKTAKIFWYMITVVSIVSLVGVTINLIQKYEEKPTIIITKVNNSKNIFHIANLPPGRGEPA